MSQNHARPAIPDRVSKPDQLAVIAQYLIASRRRRDIALQAVEFAEPAWEILLELYLQHAKGRRVSISNLCDAIPDPDTTVLRYIRTMVGVGQLIRQPDPADRRRVFIALAPEVLETIIAYLTEELRRLAPIMHRLSTNA